MITFISGGARSGKSSIAEADVLSRTSNAVYIASSRYTDEEMSERIRHHRRTRSDCFTTVEAGFRVKEALAGMEEEAAGVLDCLTVWLSEALFTEKLDEQKIMKEATAWVDIIEKRRLYVTIVSNDVNEAGLPSNDSVYFYVHILEKLHRFFIQHAENVIQVRAGFPKVWKGGIGQ
ncbi:bifunctional adenosylcobinamide kinase/adenosylcobinamide-phosphate guanylyltransferase [Alkalicoccus saliphilus]|uniref:bifunctional adenosylcobinamide kinase/adenosylcobinamide-phosphate guanylyltransferase n=1 Tax=Alkalicoccus saliphilus TaxID=200989 RepID=UPI001358CAB0|nr:bifunctional adenosylcobinamide kinase/adenosylcobinamide-phosphate guanylyltransferase [Alkalicoccus saliphilus]